MVLAVIVNATVRITVLVIQTVDFAYVQGVGKEQIVLSPVKRVGMAYVVRSSALK
jgi:hypothetical protein